MISKSVVKYIQSLGRKKFRDEHRAFIAEGFKTVNELILTNRFVCEGVYCTEQHAARFSFETLAGLPDMNLVTVEEMQKLSLMDAPPGVLGVFKQSAEEPLPAAVEGIVLALDEIRDPGNLGTIIRIADWFGVKQIVCAHGTSERYNPKVVQGSMASLGRVDVFYTDLIPWLTNVSARKYAAVLGGININKTKTETPAVLLIGNESRGIAPELLELCDQQISIAKIGEAESLNAAVATGVLLNIITAN